MFEDWLLAIGFPDADAMAQRKAALLRVSLGTEGYRIYSSLATDSRKPYNAAVARLATHFGHPASAIFNRAQFTRRQQRPGESIAQYVATLRELAAKCEFAAEQMNERVRDQFVAWAHSDRIRERLLQEPATKSLDELLTIAVTMERAMAEAPAIVESDRPVNRVFGEASGRSRKEQNKCVSCGSSGHATRSSTCPAQGKFCRGCGIIGHFIACCRQSSQRSGQTSSRGRSHSHNDRGRRFSRS